MNTKVFASKLALNTYINKNKVDVSQFDIKRLQVNGRLTRRYTLMPLDQTMKTDSIASQNVKSHLGAVSFALAKTFHLQRR